MPNFILQPTKQIPKEVGLFFRLRTSRKVQPIRCRLSKRVSKSVKVDWPACGVQIGLLILTALPVEYNAVRGFLTEINEETHKFGTVYERGNFRDSIGTVWEVALVEIGVGNVNAAVEAERAIAHFNPSISFLVGVAGGLKDVAIGDVVVARKIYGYESGKAQDDFKPRPEVFQSSYRMVQRASAEAKRADWLERLGDGTFAEPPKVHLGAIAAGEKVVASTRSSTYQFLRSVYSDALAVEMEGRGFLQATHASQPIEALVIRGISDLIDKKSEADAHGSQAVAARHASAFAFEVLSKLVAAGAASGGHQSEPVSVPDGDIQRRTRERAVRSSFRSCSTTTARHGN